MDQTVQRDPVMLSRVSEHLRISVKRAHHIVTQVLRHRKIVAVWVPKGLKDEQKATRVGISRGKSAAV